MRIVRNKGPLEGGWPLCDYGSWMGKGHPSLGSLVGLRRLTDHSDLGSRMATCRSGESCALGARLTQYHDLNSRLGEKG